MANVHRRRNKLKINGVCLAKEAGIKEGIVHVFHHLLSKQGEWCLSIKNMSFNSLDVQDATKLEDLFVEEEVFVALFDLNGNKAPGPNGFSMAFWHFSWDFVKEVMGFFKDFH